MNASEIILLLAFLYILIGGAFAAAFLRHGVRLVDPATREAPFLFRLLVFPGIVALWPVMLRKWAEARRFPSDATPPHEEHTP